MDVHPKVGILPTGAVAIVTFEEKVSDRNMLAILPRDFSLNKLISIDLEDRNYQEGDKQEYFVHGPYRNASWYRFCKRRVISLANV